MDDVNQGWRRTKSGLRWRMTVGPPFAGVLLVIGAWFALLALSATSWAALPAALIAAAIGGFLWIGDVRPPRP